MTDLDRHSSANMGLRQKKYDTEAGFITRFAMARFYTALNRMLEQVEADKVFDAGCGEGEIMNNTLAPRYKSIFGADLDSERLDLAQTHNPTLPLLQGNLQDIPFNDNSFDLVICLEVLEHVGDPQRALAEIHRVTSRYALLSVPNEPFWRIGNMARGAYLEDWGNTPEHINHWSVWGFRRFVEQHFTIVDIATPMLWSMVLAEKQI
ncbi:MAG: class I SAM-dependent methyltransferase [Aggregatilineales bacterium]